MKYQSSFMGWKIYLLKDMNTQFMCWYMAIKGRQRLYDNSIGALKSRIATTKEARQ